MRAIASAFDAMAGSYDSEFSATVIGGMMRRAVWARCAARFKPGHRVLEMNCGTGEDALWLVHRGVRVHATDISAGMLRVAKRKIEASPGIATATFERLAWEDLDSLGESAFDGILSNFGGLNCVGDLPAAARSMAAKLRPGSNAIMCIMGPAVPWEWIWFLARGRPKTAFRRLRRSGVQWSGATIRYPSIAETSRAFAGDFQVLRVSAIGALLPPPYTEKWAAQFPRVLAALNRAERRFESQWPLTALADHYVLELRRI